MSSGSWYRVIRRGMIVGTIEAETIGLATRLAQEKFGNGVHVITEPIYRRFYV